MVAAKTVINTLGPNTIVANATGCLEVTTTPYPESAWGIPWVHSLFENASAVASGIQSSFAPKKAATKELKSSLKAVMAVLLISASAWLAVCGKETKTFFMSATIRKLIPIPASSLVPPLGPPTLPQLPLAPGTNIDAIGSHQRKKDMIQIALAHGLPYVNANYRGLYRRYSSQSQKALEIEGPSYIQILTPVFPAGACKMTKRCKSLVSLPKPMHLSPLGIRQWRTGQSNENPRQLSKSWGIFESPRTLFSS